MTLFMMLILTFVFLALGIASVAIFLIWARPGRRSVSEKIAETGLALIVPVFGAMISFVLTYRANSDSTEPDSDQAAVLGGAAGGASSSIM